MVFSSLEYFVFFFVVCLLFGASEKLIHKDTPRQALLLLASLFFYAWAGVEFLPFIAFSVLTTWAASLLIERLSLKANSGGGALAAIAITANLALLFVFKYLNFASDIVASLLGAAGITLKARHFSLILPLGISFYVFQSISYVIDVYRGTVKAEHSLLCYALYVCFFPQLLQGPIERAGDLMVQFRQNCPFDYARVASGLKLFAFGLFKKACIADKLAVYVNYVWGDVAMSSGCCLLLATFFFAVQLYADFSGYTDMAVGAAKVLGFDLTANFDHPYFSRTVAEFWRRWHITLGSWFRDYLFYPLLRKLSGSLGKGLKRRVSKAAAKNVPTVLALVVVWCATGLWHGANLTFIAWGLWHGFFIILETLASKKCAHLKGALHISGDEAWFVAFQTLRTFVIVCAGYVFFRSASIADAISVFGKFTHIASELTSELPRLVGQVGAMPAVRVFFALTAFRNFESMALCMIATLALFGIEACTRNRNGLAWLRAKPPIVRWLLYWCSVLLIVDALMEGQSADFMYFAF